VFFAIRDREIKLGANLIDTEALAEQWDGVLKRGRGGAFTSLNVADGEVDGRRMLWLMLWLMSSSSLLSSSSLSLSWCLSVCLPLVWWWRP
jgi:hypothetical protein